MINIYIHRGKVSWKEFSLRIIQIFSDDDSFHVGVGWKDEPIIIESTSKRGVDLRPINHYYDLIAKKNRIIDIYKCEAEIDEKAFYGWLLNQVDRKYDFRGILGLGFAQIRGVDAMNTLQKKNDFWCSELVMTGLRIFAKDKKAFDDIPRDGVVKPSHMKNSKWFSFLYPL